MIYSKALYHRGTVPGGASLPQFFEIEGVGLAAVKFLQNPQGPRVLANELIGFGLASLLGLEHPNVGIVEIETKILSGGSLLVNVEGEQYLFEPGLHFYSQWLSDVDILNPLDLEKIGVSQNPDMLSGVVLLDLLLDNWDRKPTNINLLLTRERGRQRLKLIDLGLAFGGPLWTLGNLQPHPQFGYFPPLNEPLRYKNLSLLLKTIKKEDFTPYLSRLEYVTRASLETIIKGIPDAWEITSEERLGLLNCIMERAKGLPNYLAKRLEKEAWWL
jgi:hypothetical protein